MTKPRITEPKAKLGSAKWYQIASVDTGNLFLDEEGQAFLFSNENEAITYTEKHPGTVIGTQGTIDADQFLWKCWCIGVDRLILNGNKDDYISIIEDKQNHNYCNREFLRDYLLLLETSKQKYLESLGQRKLIVPMLITTADIQGVDKPVMKYCTVKPAQNADQLPMLYIAFTDLDHYEEWRAQQRELYKPIEVEFWQFEQIYGKCGIRINPDDPTDLVLLPEMISMIKVKAPDVSYLPAVQEKQNAAEPKDGEKPPNENQQETN